MRIWIPVFVAALAASVSCKTPEEGQSATADESVEKRAATAAQVEEKVEQPAEEESGPKFEAVKIPGTPHDQEHTTVELKWKGELAEVSLYGSPGVVSKSSGTVELSKGSDIEYSESAMFVTEPRVLTATKATRLASAAAYAPETGAVAEASRDVKVEEGEDVLFLMQAGEGLCYLGLENKYYMAVCPSAADYETKGEFAREPKDFEWWVLVKTAEGASGWLKVDDRITVDVKSTM